MKKIYLLITALILICNTSARAQEDQRLTEVFRNAYSVYEHLRASTGMYQAKLDLVNNNSLANASIAVNGMALVTVCVADQMGWIDNGQDLVIETLESLSGQTAGFTPDRNPSGFYPHFFNKNTGARAGGTSEYSSVDNAVFCAGMKFCKNYFQNHSKGAAIAALVDELWSGYDWSHVVVDPATDSNGGGMYLATDDTGAGSGNITRPYNEYILVAWMAYNHEKETEASGPAHRLWNNWFENTANLYKVAYAGYDMLTVKRKVYQAEHTYQMPYYLCHFYTTNQGDASGDKGYLHYMLNTVMADRAWFQANTTGASYEWAMSAGSGIDKESGDLTKGYYSVDAIDDNPYHIVSPHTMAAFMPVYPQSKHDLIALFENNKGVYGLPWDRSKKIIWRYSLREPSWEAPKVQGVDYAPFIFGVASLPEYCGPDFFARNNDIFDSGFLPNAINDLVKREQLMVAPNPAQDYFTIQGMDQNIQRVEIYDVTGKQVLQLEETALLSDRIPVGALNPGIYMVKATFQSGDQMSCKLIKH